MNQSSCSGSAVVYSAIHIVVLKKLKNLVHLSLVRPHLEYAAAALDPYGQRYGNSNESNVVLPVLPKKIIAIQLLSLV